MSATAAEVDLRSGQRIPPDYIVGQNFDAYSKADHATWKQLYERQIKILQGRMADNFFSGLSELQIDEKKIPDFDELNIRLFNATGWRIVAVPGLVPDEIFFGHLAERRFPAGYWIRKPDELDYIEEPDVFHDVFGHAPMLMHKHYADYMQAYGTAGLRLAKSSDSGQDRLKYLARLYWYTVEFGLVENAGRMRIFGAGIASSAGESVYALESEKPKRLLFDCERIMRTNYIIDEFQKTYFVLGKFTDLPLLDEDYLNGRIERILRQPELSPEDADPDDRVLIGS